MNKNDHFLIIASDGLWDEISRKDAAEIVSKPGNQADMNNLAGALLEQAISNVSKNRGISREFLSQAPPGPRRRSIHDDITVLVLSLHDQAK